MKIQNFFLQNQLSWVISPQGKARLLFVFENSMLVCECDRYCTNNYGPFSTVINTFLATNDKTMRIIFQKIGTMRIDLPENRYHWPTALLVYKAVHLKQRITDFSAPNIVKAI